MDTTSDPAECSDMANAPTLSPDIRPGRNLAFCSAEPFRESWLTHNWEWAAYERPMLPAQEICIRSR